MPFASEIGGGIDGWYSPMVKPGIQTVEWRAKYGADFAIPLSLFCKGPWMRAKPKVEARPAIRPMTMAAG